jgi:RHS repeat-associated protein
MKKIITHSLIAFFILISFGKISAYNITGSTTVNMGQTSTYTVPTNLLGCSYSWTVTGGTIIAPCNNTNVCTSSTNTISVVWNCTSIGVHKIESKYTGGALCLATGSLAVTVNTLNFTPGAISGPSVVCTGVNATYTTPTVVNATSYTWATNNGTIVTGQGTRTVNINWTGSNAIRTITLTTYCNACPTTAPVTKTVDVSSLPSAAGSIAGSISACISGGNTTYYVPPITNATSYTWTINGGSILSGNGTNSVSVSWTASGTKTISVKGTSSCGLGTPTTLSVTVYAQPTVAVNDTIVLNHAQMTASTATALTVDHCISNLFCSSQTIKNAQLYVTLNTGTDYEYGTNTFSAACTISITGYNAHSGGTAITSFTKQFTINQTTPEQLYVPDFTNVYSQIQRFDVKVTGYSVSALIQNAIKLTATYKEAFNSNAASSSNQPLISINAVSTNTTTNKLTFSWNTTCGKFPNYEFQLLRLYNTDTTKARLGNEQNITTKVDWNNALTIETQSPATTLTLSVVEGTGYYIWRVRPIGNFYEGGIANDKNWGVYTNTGAFVQNATVAVSASVSPFCFFYNQFSNTYNWMYSRFFAEGDEGKTGVKIKETMVYANGLMQTKQAQTLLSTEKNLMLGQTIYDYSGRQALSTMAAPVSQNFFGYVNQFAQQTNGVLYTADHFDLDNNYKNPLAMSSGSLSNYYSNNTPTGDNTIPNAEGYPYTRILFSRDGTERNAELGTPGSIHRLLQNQNEISHTKKQFYSGVAEEELLRIFGDEAPKANTVHKIINLDENNTASINYVNKEGQNIATCLSAGTNTVVLDTLVESHGPIHEVNDLLSDGVAIAPNGMISTKPVAFVTPTTLKVYYKITPKSISADCGSYCSSCDYKVYFILRNILEPDAPDFPKKDSLIIPRGTCPSTSLGINPYIQYSNLAPGSYMVEKRIYTDNINPITGISYLTEAITTYSNQLQAEIAPHFNNIMGYVNAGTLEDLNTYMQTNLDYDAQLNQYVISTSCSRIFVPNLNCSTAVCTATNFEQTLLDKWSSDTELNLGNNISNYFQTPWINGDAITTGQFNTLVTNMINDPVSPYTCQELRTCWNNIVQGFKMMRMQLNAMGKTYNPMEQFLLCAGKKYRGITATKNGASFVSPGYLSHAYAYIKSSVITSSCIAAINAAAPLSYPYSDTASWHWTNVYNCSINTSTGSTNPQSYVDTLENRCNILCDARYNGFVQSILTAYRNDPRYYIVGEATNNGTQTAVYIESIYCSASRLVENCKNGCNLTISPTQAGTPSEIDAMTKSMTSSYEVSLPNNLGTCAPGSTLITGQSSVSEMLIQYLNSKLNEFKNNIGSGISNMNVYNLLVNYNPAINTSCFTATTTVPVSNTLPCYFEMRVCNLVYITPNTGLMNLCGSGICGTLSCNSTCFKWASPTLTVSADTVRLVSCEQESLNYIAQYIAQQRQNTLDSATQSYRKKYLTNCTKMQGLDSLKVNYKLDYYHYVLSYYDRAGNLLRTVPPTGVALLNPTITAVRNRQIAPSHSLATTYRYNSLGQLIAKYSPDADTLKLFYNRVGQARFSQTAQQFATNAYAYTKYDALGRPTEKGKSTVNAVGAAFTQSVETVTFPVSGTEQTFIVYTTPTVNGNYSATKTQRNLLNHVSFAYTDKDGNAATLTDRAYTYFSYDPHGNVEWLVQELPELGKNTMRNEYDLVSGKVLKVVYNEKKPDQFMYRYSYDADNRLTNVETSKNGYLWENDATYSYYKHGSLKRVVLGEDKLQGLDYVHTIRGTLKGINHPALSKTIDPGQDGNAGANIKVAQDVFGMMLNYYQNDFNRTGSAFNSTITNSYYLPTADLFNGHIMSQVSNIATSGTGLKYEQAVGYKYRYDVLGRLKKSEFNYYSTGAFVASTDYQTQYTYDANGNMLSHKRNGYASAGLAMDDLSYNYYPGTNRLKYVSDAVTTTTVYTSDMETQSNVTNYTYDKSGNLLSDAQNNSTTTWDMDNRIDQVIIAPTGTLVGRTLNFTYDAMGHRIIKKEIATATGSLIGQTFYVYDAGGMLMANYKKTVLVDSTFFRLSEIPLYGAERLGMRNESILVKKLVSGNTVTLSTTNDTTLLSRKMGLKLYELKDHLGNARVILNDIKQPINTNSLSLGFTAQVQTYANFDPFGMEQVGRNYSPAGYRYGFNGMEKDNELMGEGNAYDFGARIYDARLGRWLSVDPLADKYPAFSPYNFCLNNPIMFVDPDGKAPLNIVLSDEIIRTPSIYNTIKIMEKMESFVKILGELYYNHDSYTFIQIGFSSIKGTNFAEARGSFFGGPSIVINKLVKDKFDTYEIVDEKTGIITQYSPDLTSIAAIIYHESFHLNRSWGQLLWGNDEHEDLATKVERDKFVNFLKEFDTKKGEEVHSDEWYQMMVWAGLEETKAFKALPLDEQEKIHDFNMAGVQYKKKISPPEKASPPPKNVMPVE